MSSVLEQATGMKLGSMCHFIITSVTTFVTVLRCYGVMSHVLIHLYQSGPNTLGEIVPLEQNLYQFGSAELFH